MDPLCSCFNTVVFTSIISQSIHITISPEPCWFSFKTPHAIIVEHDFVNLPAKMMMYWCEILHISYNIHWQPILALLQCLTFYMSSICNHIIKSEDVESIYIDLALLWLPTLWITVLRTCQQRTHYALGDTECETDAEAISMTTPSNCTINPNNLT